MTVCGVKKFSVRRSEAAQNGPKSVRGSRVMIKNSESAVNARVFVGIFQAIQLREIRRFSRIFAKWM